MDEIGTYFMLGHKDAPSRASSFTINDGYPEGAGARKRKARVARASH